MSIQGQDTLSGRMRLRAQEFIGEGSPLDNLGKDCLAAADRLAAFDAVLEAIKYDSYQVINRADKALEELS